MVQPGELNPTKRKDARDEISEQTPYKPIEPIPDEAKQGNKFKDFLDKKDPKVKKEKRQKNTPQESASPSIFSIASAQRIARSNETTPLVAEEGDPSEAKGVASEEATKIPTKPKDRERHVEEMGTRTPLVPHVQHVSAEATPQVQKAGPTTQMQSARTKEVLLKVIEQLEAQLAIVKTKEQTEVSIQLNHPPLFRGAIVVVQEHATAKGQLDITFKNLPSQEAQNLISNSHNQALLQSMLLDKGYKINLIAIDQRDITLEESSSENDAQRKGFSSQEKNEDNLTA